MTELTDLDADERLEIQDPKRLNRLRGYGLEGTLINHITDLMKEFNSDFIPLDVIKLSTTIDDIEPTLNRMVKEGKLLYGKNSYSAKTRQQMEKERLEGERHEAIHEGQRLFALGDI